MYLNSIRIDTPELYNQFVNGEIGSGYDFVDFREGAHPKIISLPIVFANHTSHKKITFDDRKYNFAALNMPSNVTFSWRGGANFTKYIPAHYTNYVLYLHTTTPLAVSDYDTILSWSKMTSLEVVDDHNFPYALLQRVDELKLLPLTHLMLTLHVLSYEELRVKAFLEKLSKLQVLEFDTKYVYEEHVDLFLQLQEVPSYFKVKRYAKFIQFVRVN